MPLLPLCFVLFCVDLSCIITFNGGIRKISKSLYRAITVMHYLILWMLLLFICLCAIQKQFDDCKFVP